MTLLVSCSEQTSSTEQPTAAERKPTTVSESTSKGATSSNTTTESEELSSTADSSQHSQYEEPTSSIESRELSEETSQDRNSEETSKETPGEASEDSGTLVAGAVDLSGGPLVKNRMVSFYGHPYSGYMGVLGQYPPEEMVRLLKEQAKAYTEIDPDRPAICTIELIASVAQDSPGPDGLYLFRTPPEVIEQYSQLAEQNGCLLLLDIQPAHSTIAAEVEIIRPFLERAHVHLALDPEWDMAPGEIPGVQFGQSTGEEIMGAARTLQQIVEEKDFEAKVLVIHQFRYDMIQNKEVIHPLKDVEVVLHADGFGVPEDKLEKYNLLVTQQPIQYGGFKLFYDQDVPLLSPEQVLNLLEPPPAVVSYQ